MASGKMDVAASDGSGVFGGYLALPAKTPAPAVVVLQEIFGVNANVRAVCDRLAANGFVACAPDLFWRLEPGLSLSSEDPDERAKGFALFPKFDVAKGIEDIAAAVAAIRRHPAVTGKVGAVGYCLGGLLAYLTAAHTDADAAVGYYGVGIQGKLEAAGGIRKPLMLHIAQGDEFVPPDAQRTLVAGLCVHPKVTLHSYPGVGHAFARINGDHYDEASATLADARTLAFLCGALK